ncbi:MAG: hypothetical protein A2937_03895 [Candidatus Yonathbacteria bacterium RIFCSPLOWO2_01_FULL_47_33b]|uniref:Lipoprotein n=1 Tax=Candidatus Yonathbacteria bacterium RIFCSPLOWO2_01_FULL_47_33b TaxID=1802727 RepID=A0A1G2SE59_9BACT|nr:MAG: hypothetical protein A2937_03895 [Candidatus Yonathbacteria bacterium RIFCSPLOWO2_01_FULL_47_33b]
MEPKKSIFKYALGIILGVLALAGVCSISGCGGGGGSSSGEVSSTTPVPTPKPAPVIPDITPTDTNGVGLPLHVRQYIEATHPNSAKERAALFQYAKVVEAALVDAQDKVKSVQHGREADLAITCLVYTFGSVEAMDKPQVELKSVILNTDERIKAYFAYNDKLGGEVFHGTPYDQRASTCAVNPSTLPN